MAVVAAAVAVAVAVDDGGGSLKELKTRNLLEVAPATPCLSDCHTATGGHCHCHCQAATQRAATALQPGVTRRRLEYVGGQSLRLCRDSGGAGGCGGPCQWVRHHDATVTDSESR